MSKNKWRPNMARDVKKPLSVRESDVKEDGVAAEIAVHAQLEAAAAAPVPKAPAEPLRMSFNAWFQQKMQTDSRIRLAHRESILAHAKAIGVEEPGTVEQWDGALAHYGL